MYDEPHDLTPADLEAVLRRFWCIDARAITYAPLGFGSYHWHTTDAVGRHWFLTADLLRGDHSGQHSTYKELRAAYEAASALHKRGLEFVVAPVSDTSGLIVKRIAPAWALAVFEWIDGAPAGSGSWPTGSRRVDAARMVGALHVAKAPRSLRRFSFAIDYSDEVFLDMPVANGPYSQRAADLLRSSRSSVVALLARYRELVAEIEGDAKPWVVTHGEPHSANFIVDGHGRLRLIDWDTVRLAPPERDLAALPMDEPAVLAAYLATGATAPRPHAIELFRAWWTLTEISLYARHFRLPHGDTEDSRVSWRGLQENIAATANWRRHS